MESIFQILYEVFHYTIISYFSLTVFLLTLVTA